MTCTDSFQSRKGGLLLMINSNTDLSPLVDLMIHEYNERYRLRLFEQPNPSKYATVRKLAEKAAADIAKIMNR